MDDRVPVINEERKKPETRYGTLHSDMKIAESVMETSQLERLKELGIHLVQGPQAELQL